MNKISLSVGLFTLLFMGHSLCFAASLSSMKQDQIQQQFVNRTLISVPTDNLNGQTIDNTFSMYLDDRGHIYGKMGHKPQNEPQSDTGVYKINADGTMSIKWQHWDGAKELCAQFYNTQNAVIAVDCDNVFHTVFMKENIKAGKHL